MAIRHQRRRAGTSRQEPGPRSPGIGAPAPGVRLARLAFVPRKALLAAVSGLCFFASAGAADVLPTARSAASVASAEFTREVLRLRHLCAPLWKDMSPDCAAELERAYLDRDVMLNWHSDREQNPSDFSPFLEPATQ